MKRLVRSPVVVAVVVVAAVSGLVPAVSAQAPGSGVVEAGSSDWRQVSAGGAHTCGIRASGRLYCWGSDSSGELGDNPTFADQPTPVEVAGGATNWASVSAGSFHTCARKTNGRLYCWGFDGQGQLGDNPTIADQPTPVEVAGGATNWASVDAGGFHTCARKTNGRLYCWGDDSTGQLGDNPTIADQPTPAQVAGGATNWASVSAGGFHTCARKTNGRLYCWGRDLSGQLGDNPTIADQPTPAQVAGGATNWASVDAGGAHTCARKTNGRLYCWGNDGNGELGDNPTLAGQSTPVQVAGGATDWTTVDAGGAHTCARYSTGRLSCWGSDIFGQLGDNPTLADQPTPVEVFVA